MPIPVSSKGEAGEINNLMGQVNRQYGRKSKRSMKRGKRK